MKAPRLLRQWVTALLLLLVSSSRNFAIARRCGRVNGHTLPRHLEMVRLSHLTPRQAGGCPPVQHRLAVPLTPLQALAGAQAVPPPVVPPATSSGAVPVATMAAAAVAQPTAASATQAEEGYNEEDVPIVTPMPDRCGQLPLSK